MPTPQQQEQLEFVATYLPESDAPFIPDVAEEFGRLVMNEISRYIGVREEADHAVSLLDFAAYLPYVIGVRDGSQGRSHT